MTGQSYPPVNRLRPGAPTAHLAASRQHDREVAAKALREAAAVMRSTVDALDPRHEPDLSYINCTLMDAGALEDRAAAIERGEVIP